MSGTDRRWLRVVLAAVVTGPFAAGCSASGSSSGAGPWIVCGTMLSAAPAGAVVTDATGPGQTVRVGNLTSGGIALRISEDCDHGADLTVAPADAAAVTGRALAQNGGTVAAVLAPHRASFTITVTRAGAARTLVAVDLGAIDLRPWGGTISGPATTSESPGSPVAYRAHDQSHRTVGSATAALPKGRSAACTRVERVDPRPTPAGHSQDDQAE